MEGNKWVPKKKFATDQEIENTNFPVNYKFHSYDCNVCGFKHISTDKKRVKH
jgi:hypothetical protein